MAHLHRRRPGRRARYCRRHRGRGGSGGGGGPRRRVATRPFLRAPCRGARMTRAPIAARARRDRLSDDLAGIATIARLSLFETLRRRLLWALVGLTLLLVVVTAWAFQRLLEASPLPTEETQLAVSQLLVLVAFMFS